MNRKEYAAGLPATSHYRYAKRVGPQLFVAGQVPQDSAQQIVGRGDPAAQARQCLTNLSILIDVHNFSLQDIQRLVIYVVGERTSLTNAWQAVEDWFDQHVPPATLLGVTTLGHAGQLVEIDATIVRDK